MYSAIYTHLLYAFHILTCEKILIYPNTRRDNVICVVWFIKITIFILLRILFYKSCSWLLIIFSENKGKCNLNIKVKLANNPTSMRWMEYYHYGDTKHGDIPLWKNLTLENFSASSLQLPNRTMWLGKDQFLAKSDANPSGSNVKRSDSSGTPLCSLIMIKEPNQCHCAKKADRGQDYSQEISIMIQTSNLGVQSKKRIGTFWWRAE